MVVTNQTKNQHLLWRAGFGPMAEDIGQLASASQKSYLHALTKASKGKPEYIDVADNYIKGLMMGIDEVGRMQRKELSDEEKKKLRQASRDSIKSLNLTWLNTMVNSEAQLREKMSLFWHGHFASRNLNILYQQQLLDIIRRNALENFGDLLREVSKSAAMINFLNNNQNRKDHPNENFAREVMELFTMGRGNYTEQDVKEAARAFTGWGATLKGDFVFRRMLHDEDSKEFLGKSGRFDGDDILDMLIDQRATANFITRKIYRYFVNEQVDEEKVKWLANRFYKDYNIQSLMEDIFSSDWFYDEKNIGARIKSPIELMVGIRRILPMQLENDDVELLVQRLLGQILFYPPNVAGWPGGTNWIDSSSLMFRLRLPQMIHDGEAINLSPKTDDDQQMGMKEEFKFGNGKGNQGNANKLMKQPIAAQINWTPFIDKFASVPKENLVGEITKTLLQTSGAPSQQLIDGQADKSSREAFIKSVTISLMATPEYQLC
jgi:uncharacterized protein (DUF1800 family)